MSRQASPQKINKLTSKRELSNQAKLSGSTLDDLTDEQHLLAKKILANTFGGDGHLKASWDKAI